MEQFDKVWDILVVVIPMVMSIATLITAATESPKDDEVLGKIAYFISRIFSFSTYKSPTTGKAKVSLPVVGSAKPKE
jgi:hypothetical protein